MIHAFVGIIQNERRNCIRGGGKTCSMTGYLLLAKSVGKQVYTNYYTDFSDKIDSAQNIITYLHENEPGDVIVGFTEFQNTINSMGTGIKATKFINRFASQIRKLDCDALYDTQRLADIHVRLRNHTDYIWIPEKRHRNDLSLCNNDRCPRTDHDIYVYRAFPEYPYWIRNFKADIIGKHYNSRERIYDEIDKNVQMTGDKSYA